MKSAQLHAYGDPSEVKIENSAKPEPEPNEILICVVSASVNPLDIKLIKGVLHDAVPLAETSAALASGM